MPMTIPVIFIIRATVGEKRWPAATSKKRTGKTILKLFNAYKNRRTNAAASKLSGV
jgi:hypothetical protein